MSNASDVFASSLPDDLLGTLKTGVQKASDSIVGIFGRAKAKCLSVVEKFEDPRFRAELWDNVKVTSAVVGIAAGVDVVFGTFLLPYDHILNPLSTSFVLPLLTGLASVVVAGMAEEISDKHHALAREEAKKKSNKVLTR